jgi:hypothetical protein
MPVLCSIDRCSQPASLLHRGKHYCGRHALDLLNAGERPDMASDFPSSAFATRMDALPPNTKQEGDEETQFNNQSRPVLSLAEVRDQEEDSEHGADRSDEPGARSDPAAI